MNVKDVLCLDSLLLGEFAIFCGAGISKNSGLPLANELKQSILEKLPIDKKDIDEVMNSNIPFEAFMETISENTDIPKILDIFEQGVPNTNHILIARLAKNGFLKTIYTTNFDLLIEKALEKEGLIRDKNFKVYCDEEQFSRLDFESMDDKIVRVFKIHGSVDNRHSIRTTLKAVASKTPSDRRVSLIRYLFSTGNHRRVLILGYSCSDEFDITPQIQSIEENKKEIIFIDHCKDGTEIEDVGTKEQRNPFETFPGKRMKCNTDDFLRDLWHSLEKTVGEYEPIQSKLDWEIYLDHWIVSNKGLLENDTLNPEYFIASLIFHRISNFEKVIEYSKKSLGIAKRMGDRIRESACCINLGVACRGLGRFNEAIKYCEKALEINLEIKKVMGDIAVAQEAECYGNLGIVYNYLGEAERAVEYHQKALEIRKALRDTKGESVCYTNLGVAYDGLGRFNEAIKYYEKALEIKKVIGDIEGEARCYGSLGAAYHGLRNFEIAIEYHEKALKIETATGNKQGKSRSYGNLGAVYCDLGNLEKGIEYYAKALKIAKEIGDRELEARCYGNLGAVYCSLKDFERAIEHSLNAERIFKDTGQIKYLKAVYRNIALAYENIGDNEKTKDYKRKLSSDIESGSGTSYNTV